MHFPFDPEMRFGPWMFYLIYACSVHTAGQVALAVLGLIFQRAQQLLLTLGTALAMCSGAGFIISFGWGNEMEDPYEAMAIAWNLALGAAAAGPLLFAYALTRWRSFYDELSMPSWIAMTNLGGCSTFACVVALNFAQTHPNLQMALVLVMLFSVTVYWSPLFLLPWKMLTKMDPMNFTARLG